MICEVENEEQAEKLALLVTADVRAKLVYQARDEGKTIEELQQDQEDFIGVTWARLVQ